MLRPPRRSPKLISSINVTAFLAVQIVLLVLFMVRPPHMPDLPVRVDVDLAKIVHPVPMQGANREDAIMISVKRDGAVYFGGDRVNVADLPAKILAALDRGAERKVYINADARAAYKIVREVEAAMRAAGIENVAFLVESRSSL